MSTSQLYPLKSNKWKQKAVFSQFLKPIHSLPGVGKLYNTLIRYNFLCLKGSSIYFGLKTRWILYLLSIMLAFSIILGSFFFFAGKKDLEMNVTNWAASMSENLAYSARPAVLVHDYVSLQNYLMGIMNDKEILYAAILDKEGSILAILDPNWLFNPQVHDHSITAEEQIFQVRMTEEGNSYYHIIQPIQMANENITDERILFEQLNKPHMSGSSSKDRLGTLVIGISAVPTERRVKAWINNAIPIALAITILFIISAFFLVDKMVTPIKQLVEGTKKVALGQFSHYVDNNRKDELGILAGSFNDMIVKLNKSNAKVKDYTDTLEKRIYDRTVKLRASEQKYRTLFEHSGTAVAIVNQDEILSMVNKQFENLSGYSKEELEGKKFLTEFLGEKDKKYIDKLCHERRAGKEVNNPIHYEFSFVNRLKNEKKVNLTMSLVPGSKKILASLVDVTEFRELQKKLSRSEQLAAIGELSASIAHEIRNPLGAINTSVGILHNELQLSGDDRELLDIIREETGRLDRIIKDFLHFARLNKSRFQLTDVNNLTREILLLYRNIFGTFIQKHEDFEENLASVYMDPDQVKQVLINVLLNAKEAMPRGGEMFFSTRQENHKNVKIIIQDTGCGMDESTKQKIFQPFFSTKEKGVGMGLSICDRIIQNHGGAIHITSGKEKGTTFEITLPIRPNDKMN